MALAQGLTIFGVDIGGLADLAKLGVNGLLCLVNNHDVFKTALNMKTASKQHAHQFK
ncbi:MAG: glycosyltransferase family 1 protein [Thioploca sp.]|nr:glycosyltransferase family 1 protein [Thioploca sp.]